MKKKILRNFLTYVMLFSVMAFNAQTFTFSTDLEGWAKGFGDHGAVSHAAGEGVNSDGALKLERASDNANFGKKPNPGINATNTKFIKIVFKNETEGTRLRVGGKNDDGVAIKNAEGKNIELNITSNSSSYVTKYIDMSAYPLWKGELQDILFYVRVGSANDADGSAVYVDEIEFIESLPAPTNSEFIKNPSFDDVVGGIDHLTGNQNEFTRSIDGTVKKDGANSYKMAFNKIQPTKSNWNFTNYTHSHASTIVENSVIEVKMWVKTNRTGVTAPFKVTQRTKTLLDAVEVRNGDGDYASDSQTTTNTSGEWEELTFTYTAPGDFNKSQFWFSVDFEEGSDINMNLNDVVWFDQMSVTISDPSTASVKNNTLEGVSVYPNPVSNEFTVSTIEGGEISLYSILGVKVLSQRTANKNLKLNIADVSSGVYLLKVVSRGKSFTQKVIKK